MSYKEVVEEIFENAIHRVSVGGVGEPGQPAPQITEEQFQALASTETRLLKNKERASWQIWNRGNSRPETRDTRRIGGQLTPTG